MGASPPQGSGGVSSGAIDGAFGSTQGQILYRGASAWLALNPGTSGHYLRTQGSGANPAWAAVVAGGETLAQTLAIGATTGGTSPVISSGDSLRLGTTALLKSDGQQGGFTLRNAADDNYGYLNIQGMSAYSSDDDYLASFDGTVAEVNSGWKLKFSADADDASTTDVYLGRDAAGRLGVYDGSDVPSGLLAGSVILGSADTSGTLLKEGAGGAGVQGLQVRLGDDSAFGSVDASRFDSQIAQGSAAWALRNTDGTLHWTLYRWGASDAASDLRIADEISGYALYAFRKNASTPTFTLASQGQIGWDSSSNSIAQNISLDTQIKRDAAGVVGLYGSSANYGRLALASGVHDLAGSGSPEGVITAAVGSVYRRTNGSSGTTLYTKASGSGNTGWEPLAAFSGSLGTSTLTWGTGGSWNPNSDTGEIKGPTDADIYIVSGRPDNSSDGWGAYIYGALGGSSAGAGGPVGIVGGSAQVSGYDGGSCFVSAGISQGSAAGGSVYCSAGAANGTGTGGDFVAQAGDGTTKGTVKLKDGGGTTRVTVSTTSVTVGNHLLFTDATYDIGASGATRPRNVYTSAGIYGPVPVTVTSGSVSVSANASGTVYANSAALTPTLPSAAAGLIFTFVVQHASALTITANTGDTIRLAGSVSATAGTCASSTVGDAVTLVAIDSTQWVATTIATSSGWTVT